MVFDVDDVRAIAYRCGYTQCQADYYEGKLGFRRVRDIPELVEIWYNTGTVATKLKHPRHKSPTQLFRREVFDLDDLEEIFDNPRVHTGRGYQRTHNDPSRSSNPNSNRAPRDTVCPGCSRTYRGMIGVVSHFESGSCSSCMGAGNARRQAYNLANASGGDFLIQRIGWHGSDDGYDSDGPNYQCNCCDKQFATLNGLMQHQTNKATCREYLASRNYTRPMLGF